MSRSKKQKDDAILRRGLTIGAILGGLLLTVGVLVVYAKIEAPKSQEKLQYVAAQASINELSKTLSNEGHGTWISESSCRLMGGGKISFEPAKWDCYADTQSVMPISETLEKNLDRIESRVLSEERFVETKTIEKDQPSDLYDMKPGHRLLYMKMKESNKRLPCYVQAQADYMNDDSPPDRVVVSIVCRGHAVGLWYPTKQ